MIKFFDNLKHKILFFSTILLLACQPLGAQTAGKPLVLPVRYDEHRFYVEPVTTDGTKLSFFTDTGGGLFLFADVVERLKLPVERIEEKKGQTMETITLPKFKDGTFIPPPLGSEEKLFVAPLSQRISLSKDWSGMLGQQWFAGRVWTFDYPKRQLLLRAAGDVPKIKDKHSVALGFQINAAGKRAANFPRIPVLIDGETIDLLFDTGASTELTETALAALADKRPAVRATSFITSTIFEKWREKHPDWRVIDAAEKGTNQAMIEVPKIAIGGYTVENVWFTRRPDKNFHEFMSRWMDKRVEGAIGGNALRQFRITVDYPNARAVFER